MAERTLLSFLQSHEGRTSWCLIHCRFCLTGRKFHPDFPMVCATPWKNLRPSGELDCGAIRALTRERKLLCFVNHAKNSDWNFNGHVDQTTLKLIDLLSCRKIRTSTSQTYLVRFNDSTIGDTSHVDFFYRVNEEKFRRMSPRPAEVRTW